MRQVADRVSETSVTAGAGNLALGGALIGFRTFASVCAVGDTFDYAVWAVDNNNVPTGDWETGRGTLNNDGTFSRAVQSSSNGNAAVNFAVGTKIVALTENAASILALMAGGGGGSQCVVLAHYAANFQHGGDGAPMLPDTFDVNVGGAWAQATGTFTAPADGLYRVQAYAQGQSQGAYKIFAFLNGSDYYYGSGGWDDNLHVEQGFDRVMSLKAGDHFTVNLQRGNNPTFNGGKGGSFIYVTRV